MLTLAKIRADCQPKTLFVPLSTRLTQQKTIHSDGPTGSSKVSCKIPSSTPLHALSGPYEYKDLTPELKAELLPLSSVLLPAASVSDIRKPALEIPRQVTWVGGDVNGGVDS